MRTALRNMALLAAAVLAALTILSSCGSETDEARETGATGAEQAAPPATVSITPRRVYPDLSFEDAVFLTWVPGAGDRFAVVEQAGRVWLFPRRDDVSRDEDVLLLDITGRVQSGGEEGMLGLAFDPGFDVNGFFYVYYSAGGPRRSVISRFTVTDPAQPESADPDSEQVILEVEQPQSFSNHKAGTIAFGPDGAFYIALGDGGGSGDPRRNAQNLGTPLGKILRIELSGDSYTVPEDNPFAGTEGNRGEIWAYGFRNPYRFSFDRETGELWAGDVGERDREEIDLVRRGGNYGWDLFEGTKEHEDPDRLPAEELVFPVTEYGRSQGRSVVGGYVYRGSLDPALDGVYFYADFYSGRIWALKYAGDRVVFNEEVASLPQISSFAEDRRGELYALAYDGSIYRISAGD